MKPKSLLKLFVQIWIIQMAGLWIFYRILPVTPSVQASAIFLDYAAQIFVDAIHNNQWHDLNRVFVVNSGKHAVDVVIYDPNGSPIFKNSESIEPLKSDFFKNPSEPFQRDRMIEIGKLKLPYFHYLKSLWKEERLLGFMELKGRSRLLPDMELGSLFPPYTLALSFLSSLCTLLILYFIWILPKVQKIELWQKKSQELTRSLNGDSAGHTGTESMEDIFQRTREVLFELKSKTREWETLLSSMNEGVIAVDKHFRIQTINAAAKKMFAMGIEIVRDSDLLKGIRNSKIEYLIRRTLDLNEDQAAEVHHVTQSKSLQLKIHCSPWKDANQNLLGVVLVVADLSRLHDLENVRRDFVANVSHELRTPITSIQGYVETLLDGAYKNEHDALHFLEIIKRQSERLNGIIEDLLTLSRIEKEEDAEVTIEKQWYTVHEIFNDIQASFEQKINIKHISMVCECSRQLKLCASKELIILALSNLVDNALKHSQSQSEIHLRAFLHSNNQVAIEVQDFGIGIAPVHIPRLFERFYRVDKARSRKNGGTGLGLAIVKHIAIAHGGDITVESKPGKGSTFRLIV